MTPTVTVEEFRAEDAEPVARVRRAAVPYLVCTGEVVAWTAASAPAHQRTKWLVAREPDGRITGCADAGLLIESTEAGQGFLHTAVHPDALGRGTGHALAVAGERYLSTLNARRVHTWVPDDGRSPGFAERRGYERGRRACFLGLDLARAGLPSLPDPLPAGVELRTAEHFAGDQRPLYEADLECIADEPGDVQAGFVPYEDWLRLNWERPDIDHRLTSVVMLDGEVAAYSVAQTDGRDRYWSGMTGTRRAFRGRGLAKLAKLDSLLRSRSAGVAWAFTGNDAANAPMLAVNKRLGYTQAATEWRYAKAL
ncbi:GNAT family N-acetyltransferase [Streptomyces albidus (ex Kaewkla and Franco 2022)]|uniref:GNAT family N-acetyltransferase n=1 Tax=Streptomyces albidus (ex Kaewkla and Franco 2022) TaxID=722709 RepID=UPI0015EEC9EE|nr:GNAT family N-acetyltransferase [Streptomyces albidus (ex Kaewkla and Franco 2022)]